MHDASRRDGEIRTFLGRDKSLNPISIRFFSVQAGIMGGWFNPLDNIHIRMNAIMTQFDKDVDQLNVYFLGQKI